MPDHLSPAQVLPIDVLRPIMKWIVFYTRSPMLGSSCKVSHLKELLTVCSTWRHAALGFLWKRLGINIYVATNDVRLRRPNWAEQNALPPNAAGLARKIHVSVAMCGIVSGVAHKLLNDYIGHTKCFPLANKLIVEITDYKGQSFDANDAAITNAIEFAKFLKSMASSAITVDLICCGGYSERRNIDDSLGSNLNEEILKTLASVLYNGKIRRNLDLLAADLELLSTIDHIPQLTSLRLNCERAPDVHASLVRRSASTLQHLNITIHDASTLIYNVHGEAVVYPKLQYLLISSSIRNSSDTRATSPAVDLFPKLRGVTLNSFYPFDDDVLFRGNSATLEYLNFRMEMYVIDMLNRCKTFENKDKVLRHVNLGKGFDTINLSRASKTSMSTFIRNLASSAQSLTVPEWRVARGCISAAKGGQWLQNIKVFDLRSENLSLSEVFELLKALPALISLRTSINGLGPALENIAYGKLPAHVVSTYRGAGDNLQVWTMNSINAESAGKSIDYILLLALTCPKLRRIETTPIFGEGYHTRLARSLGSDPYKKYAMQLSHLSNAAFTLYGHGRY